ncbi:hypothetical protein [Rhizobium sp. MHM7A]|nr:hypothetical protein [Rhizobium sp. MHM7A]
MRIMLHRIAVTNPSTLQAVRDLRNEDGRHEHLQQRHHGAAAYEAKP